MNKIWAIGGGKGGTGKTLLVANMGVYLSKLGEKVLLVDDDLMGGNLHTCLGLDPPAVSLNDFLSERIDSIENAIVDTGYKNLKLISQTWDPIMAANLGQQEKSKLIKTLRGLDFNYILVDIGSGVSMDVLDTFRNVDYGIFVITPEPTAIENAYRLLRGLIFYQIRKATMPRPIRELVHEVVGDGKNQASQSPVHLIKAIAEIDSDKAKSLSKRIRALQLKMVLNYVTNYEDIEIGFSIRSACKKYFGIEFDYIGYINKDDHMMESVRLRKPILSEFPNSNSARCIENITNKLLTKEQLSFDFL